MPQFTVNGLPAPFITNPVRTAMVQAYRNKSYIADLVMPRVPVDAPLFYYSAFGKETFLTVPDTKPIGRKGAVPEVDFKATQLPANTEDYGFDEVVPRKDQAMAQAQGSPIDPRDTASIITAERLALQREARVANMVFNTASYASGNYTTLSGTSQWSDFSNSDPLAAVTAAQDGMLIRPNIGVAGRLVATKLQTHPKIVAAWHGNQGASGKAPLDFVAELFGLDAIYVGDAFGGNAAGANIARLWGKGFAMLYQAPQVLDLENNVTFGATAQWGSKISGEYFDEKKGLRGADVIRTGESVKELVLANDAGYFFQNAIA